MDAVREVRESDLQACKRCGHVVLFHDFLQATSDRLATSSVVPCADCPDGLCLSWRTLAATS